VGEFIKKQNNFKVASLNLDWGRK